MSDNKDKNAAAANMSVRQAGLDVVRRLLLQKELQELPGFEARLEDFQKRFQDEEFRIAVVGEFSSGKSTFINALIGQDVLTHALQETTATLTRLVNVAPDDSRNGKGCVTLRDGSCIKLNSFQELQDYTTTASKKLDVAAKVAQVELYLSIFPSERTIVIVDTPGLNGMADGHREQTEEVIRQAHACIYLIQRRGLSENDLNILRGLTENQKNFIFIQNFIDELHSLEGETLEKKLAEQSTILREKVFAQAADAQYSICGISAWQALAGRDHGIRTEYYDDTEPISEQRRAQLYADSNFQQFLDLLQELLRADRLAQVQYGGTAKAMVSWLAGLMRQMDLQKRQLDDAYQLSMDRRMIERLDERIRKTQAEQDQTKQQLVNFIKMLQRDLKKAEKTALEKSVMALCEETIEEIRNYGSEMDSVAAAQGVDDWQKKMLAGSLNEKSRLLFQKEQNEFAHREENVGQLLLERINEYRGPKVEKLELDPKAFRVDKLNLSAFDPEDRTQKDEDSLKADIGMLEQTEQRIAGKAAEKRNARDMARSAESRYQCMKSSVERIEEQLGTRPEPVPVTRYEFVDRGGLLGWLLKPKKIEITDWDYSETDAWDEKNLELIKMRQKEWELEQKTLEFQQMEEKLSKEQKICEEKYQKLEEKIRRKEEQLKKERELLEKEKIKAADSYLALSKRKLKEQVEAYLSTEPIDGHLWYEMWRIMERQIAAAEAEYTKIAVEQLEKVIRDKISYLEKAKNGRRSELQEQAQVLGKYSELLGRLKHEMEEQIV